MEYDISLGQLQREIKKLHLNENISDFDESVAVMSQIFLENHNNLRNLIYYLILTSDHGLIDELLDDPVVGFLLANHVSLKMSWVVQVLCNLDFGQYLMEIVEYGPVGVSGKLLIELPKYSVHPCEIIGATASKIVRLLHKKEHKTVIIEKHFLDAITAFQKIYCNTVSENKGHDFAENVLKYLHCLNGVVKLCFEERNSDLEVIYSIGSEYEKPPLTSPKFGNVTGILNQLLLILEDVLSKVSIDMWIFWGEIDTTSNMQTDIGNEIFKFDQFLSRHKVSIPKKLQDCLNQLKIKPFTEEDEISIANLSLLVERVNQEKSPITDKWYNALCQRDEAWKDPKIVCTLLSKLRLAENANNVIQKSMQLLLAKRDVKLTEAFFIALESAEFTIQMDVFETFMGYKNVADYFSIDSKSLITPLFNKLSVDSQFDDAVKYLTRLVIVNPTCVFQNVFHLVASAIENHELCKKFCVIWNSAFYVTTFCDDETGEMITGVNIFNAMFQTILNANHTDKEWQNLADFLCEDFRKPCSFLSECLINSLEKALSERDWNRSKYVVMMLRSIVNQEMAGNSMEVLMGFIAQVLFTCSWDARSFDPAQAEVYKLCSGIVSDAKLCGLDSVWLSEILSQLPNHTQTHFCDLWLREDRIYPKPSKPFLCLLIAARTKSIPVQSAMRKYFISGTDSLEHRVFSALFKILPIIHSDEWVKIFEFCCSAFSKDDANVRVDVFKIFSRAVTAFSACWEPVIQHCVEYCVGNLSLLFKMILEGGELKFDDRIKIFKLLVKPLENMSATAKDSCYFLMLPMLVKCVKIGDNEDGDALLPFLNSVDETWRDKFQEALQTPWNANSHAGS